MAIDLQTLQSLTSGTTADAWRTIIKQTIDIASKPLTLENAANEVIKRDREIGILDNYLSATAWELWQSFGDNVERTSDKLVGWWSQPYSAKAVLILDGLSLRELPWLLQGAKARGFTLHEVSANAAEIPCETNEFANALGFSSRSQLQNHEAGQKHRLQTAHTESTDMPWRDCAGLINGEPNWVLWHQWPDNKLHDGAGAGQGLDKLTRDVAEQLGSDDFWAFIERLASGRRLLITSDHGYAATGLFPDAEGELGKFLKDTFASGRNAAAGETGPFVPPVALQLNSQHGLHRLALGRWKWKSQGGYPTLTHGGLSLLEVLSPWVELSKQEARHE